MKISIILLALLCTAVFAQQKGTFTDPRDKKSYKTVKIGKQTWMAENLNYAAEGSVCYDNKPANCTKYGKLYDWEIAKKACPSGWHLPNREEWDELVDFVGGKEVAGKKLKSKTGWKEHDFISATDEFGFSALPGGYGYFGGNFDYIGNYGDWWSSSEDSSGHAYSRYMYYSNEDANYSNNDKSSLFSVRCVMD